METILITGGTGFLGTHVTKVFKERYQKPDWKVKSTAIIRQEFDTAYIAWDGEIGSRAVCIWISDDTGKMDFYSGTVTVKNYGPITLIHIGVASFVQESLQETTQKEFLTVIGVI